MISQHNIFKTLFSIIYLKHVHVKIIILKQNILALLIKDVVCENICRLKIIGLKYLLIKNYPMTLERKELCQRICKCIYPRDKQISQQGKDPNSLT